MSEPIDRFVPEDPQGIDPKPDPWGSAGANATQAIGTGAGAASLGVLTSNSPAPGTDEASLALLPDPAEIFGHVAHVLGFQLNSLSAWRLGIILLVICVALNILSLWLRYRYAQRVLQEHAARQAELDAKEKALQRQATAQKFIGGDA